MTSITSQPPYQAFNGSLEPLMHHQELIPEIAALRYRTFSYLTPDLSAEDYVHGLEQHLNTEKLPIAFVCLDQEEFAGTFFLNEQQLPTHNHLSPWLGGVIVSPEKRNRGIGAFLVRKAEAVALTFGFGQLYLFTPDKSPWYASLGWNIVEKTSFNNHPVTIMKKNLTLENI